MNLLKYVGISAGVAILVVVVALSFRPVPQVPQAPGIIKEVIREIRETVGAIPGNRLPNRVCQGDLCTEVVSGSCNDASTTIFAVQNPFRASSTVTIVQIDGTIGTTTPDIFLGTSTLPSAMRYTPTTERIFWGFRIPTSTASFYLSNYVDPTIGDNNNQRGQGIQTLATSTAQSFMLGPLEYVHGVATNSYSGARDGISGDVITGIIGGNNTFSCSYLVKFERRSNEN